MSVSRKNGEIYYTDKELQAALQNNNALEYALSRGYSLIKYNSEYHLKEHDSMVFKRDGRWYWNSRNLHGHAIDFIRSYENRSYKEAVCILAGTIDRSAPVGPPKNLPAMTSEEKAEFILPERSHSYKNLFAYLIKERGIDPDLVKDQVEKRKIYQGITYSKLMIIGYSKDGAARYDVKEKYKQEFTNVPRLREQVSNGISNSPFHTTECLSCDTVQKLMKSDRVRAYQNLIMLGYDSGGTPHYASMRSMNSSGKAVKVDVAGSDKSYPFVLNGKLNSDTVCVFESPVEAMSYWTLCRITGSERVFCPMISQGGAAATLALDRYLKEHPEIRRIIVGLNNDSRDFGHNINAGRNGAEKIREMYGKSYTVIQHCPHLNDWNDVLKNYRNTLEGKIPELRSTQISQPPKAHEIGIAI